MENKPRAGGVQKKMEPNSSGARQKTGMAGWTDDSILEACRAGDPEPFGELVGRYQDRLYATLLRLTGNPEDALDLLQDAFVAAYSKLDRFRGGSSFYTWIYRIAVNLALTQKRKRPPARPVAWLSAHDGTEPPDERTESDPTGPLEQAERDRIVQEALNALAPEHRAVLVLKDVDGLRYEEIAEILAVPIGTVRSRLHRARGELRERLRGVVEDAPVR